MERRTIAKVYKTGRFILEGDKLRQQYTPHSDGDSARASGEGSWTYAGYVYADTPERRARLADREAEAARERRWRQAIATLQTFRPGDINDADVEALEAAARLVRDREALRSAERRREEEAALAAGIGFPVVGGA
jgi:hypothetical protein